MPNDKKQLKKTSKPKDFSIDDFLGEIEKAEDIKASKRLPQERLKNKRRLDKEARQLREKELRTTTKTSHPETKTGIAKNA